MKEHSRVCKWRPEIRAGDPLPSPGSSQAPWVTLRQVSPFVSPLVGMSDLGPVAPEPSLVDSLDVAPLAADSDLRPSGPAALPPAAAFWEDDRFNWEQSSFMCVRKINALREQAGLYPRRTYPPARPNTNLPFSVYDPADAPAMPPRLRASAWSTLLSNYPEPSLPDAVLGIIQHGARLGYDGPLRGQTRKGVANHYMDEEALAAVREGVARAVNCGYSRVAQGGEATIESPIGAVSKRDGGFRMINDLSWPRDARDGVTTTASVNDGIQYPEGTLRYTTIDRLLSKIVDSDSDDLWVWKVDLKDAFRHLPVAMTDVPLLGFNLDGVSYVDLALNFGGRSSPFLFNLVAEALHWILDNNGLEADHFLDDFFGVCRSAQGFAILRFVNAVCNFLGLTVSRPKCLTGQRVEVLGILIDTPLRRAWLTEAKLLRIRWTVRDLLAARSARLPAVERIAGLLHDACHVCRVGRAFTRSFYDWLAAHGASRSGHKDIALSRDVLDDLRWWNNLLKSWPGVALLQPPQGYQEIWTDASLTGLGGVLGSQLSPLARFSVAVPDEERGGNIMTLEASAVLHALQLWGERLEDLHVTAHIDNQAVAEALVRGRIRHRSTQRVIRHIFTLVHNHRISLSIRWVPSAENAAADALSRQVQPGPGYHFISAEARPPTPTRIDVVGNRQDLIDQSAPATQEDSGPSTQRAPAAGPRRREPVNLGTDRGSSARGAKRGPTRSSSSRSLATAATAAPSPRITRSKSNPAVSAAAGRK